VSIAIASIAALSVAVFARPHNAKSTDEPSTDFAVLQSSARPDSKVLARLPDFVVLDTARLAYTDESGSYVAARSDRGEVCMAWLATAGGNYTSCQDFTEGFALHPPLVAINAGGYGAGDRPRVLGLVPDFIDAVRLSDGQNPEIKSNVFSVPAEGVTITVAGGTESWTLP
jgi:hypothetical protein